MSIPCEQIVIGQSIRHIQMSIPCAGGGGGGALIDLDLGSRYAKAARKDIFMCIATEKRSISLEFKTNRQSVPSFAAIACTI